MQQTLIGIIFPALLIYWRTFYLSDARVPPRAHPLSRILPTCGTTGKPGTNPHGTRCTVPAGLVPHSSVSLLLGFSAMLSVSLVSRVTATSLHDNMLGCQTPSGEQS